MNNTLTMGNLRVRKGMLKAPISWRVRNVLRWGYISGSINVALAKAFTWLTGVPVITSELRGVLRHNGVLYDYGVLGRKCITTAGITFIAACWADAAHAALTDLPLMKWHGCGTGAVAENITDTDMGTGCTTILNPDNKNIAGVPTSSGGVVTTSATLTYDGAGGTITEHGLFNREAVAGGSLWDRTVFTGVAVVATDTLTFTYQTTFTAGG